MRIAYVVIHLGNQLMLSGVGDKVQTHVRLWREKGHVVRLFLLTQDEPNLEGVEIYRFTPGILTPTWLRFVTREVNRSRMLKQLIEGVALYQPDIIYLRYGLFTVPLQKLYRIAPVVVETNTNDIDEYRHRGPFYYWINRFTRGILLGNAAGIITPSNEVANLPANQVYRRPIRVVSNGIDFERYESLPAPSNPTPVLAMVATPGNPWNGVDKLRQLALRCPDLKIMVIGYGPQDLDGYVPENMQLCGFVEHSHVANLLSQADVALGTMALHRKNMDEVPPLKLREALVLGMPVILSHRDPDLSDLEAEFILHLPNTENNVVENIDRIRDFAYRMIGKRADRALVRPLIDQQRKEEERLAFFAAIFERQREGSLS
jgi:glycosyltransferase involved in cell wall biosynthesis